MKNKYQFFWLLFMLLSSTTMTFIYMFKVRQQIFIILWLLCSIIWGILFGLELGEWLNDKRNKD